MRSAPLAWLLALALVGCDDEGIDPAGMADPASCEGCHPDQVREWSGSMHAHSSDDPVFVAIEQLGQEETAGALGGLCVGCHAPAGERGVGCVACHQVGEVVALHNGGLRWERDRTMRGGLADPRSTPAHGSAYSPLVDSQALESSAMCGACHDVVTPSGIEVERTYAEWSASVFARPEVGLSCAACHMPTRAAPAAYGEVTRRVHDHGLAGVDVAAEPWPEKDAQRAAIERDLSGVLLAKLCAQPTGGGIEFDVTLDDVQAGHAFPSGVTHARRAWVELVAEEGGATSFELGVDGPEGWVMGSRFVDAGGAEVANVWSAAAIESELLPPAVTLDPQDPAYYHAVTRAFFVPGAPDVVRMVVKLQPIALDALDQLVAAGRLDAAVRDAMPTFELASTAKEWQRARDGYGCAP